MENHRCIKDIADRVLWLEDGQFKEMVTMVIDPVCQMMVEKEKSLSGEWNGKVHYFCTRGCREEIIRETGRLVLSNTHNQN